MQDYDKTLLVELQKNHAVKLKELRLLKIWRSSMRLPVSVISTADLKKIDKMNELKKDIRKLSVQILRLKQPNLF